MSKSLIYLVNSFLGNFYRHLATFTGHMVVTKKVSSSKCILSPYWLHHNFFAFICKVARYGKKLLCSSDPRKKKDTNSGGSQAPEAAALQHLGIAIGSKNMKTIKKEEIDSAFVNQLHESEYRLSCCCWCRCRCWCQTSGPILHVMIVNYDTRIVIARAWFSSCKIK